MSQGPKLELRQSQSLVMTQQLQQSIKLLQCTSLELKDIIDLELEKNPFLSVEEGEPDPSKETAKAEDGEPKEADFNQDSDHHFEGSDQSETWDESSQAETDYVRQDSRLSIQTSGGGRSEDGDELTIDDNAAPDETLREHMLSQLAVDIHDPVQRMIATHLIDLIDDAGYIKEDLSILAEQLGADLPEVETVLGLLQHFDPPGIAARCLQECLSLQLAERNRLDPAMQALLDNLPLIAEAKFAELEKRCGVDREDLKDMIGEIRALNPKPGAGFEREISQAIEPDVFVRRLPNGEWHVELNMGNFPRVMVNQRYFQRVSAESRNTKDKGYLKEQISTASWLVRALEQRAETLLKVSSELVKQQDAFFRLGVRYLKPMTLKDIAAVTGYHESTVSRVTTHKYLSCPRGTFELKYFFTSGIARATGGDDMSSAAVKHHIRELIEKENEDAILSDDKLVDLLKDRNIDVARRTVAKYREAMNIPSSSKRKRLKVSAL